MSRFIHKINPFSYILVMLLVTTLLSALIMSSASVSADAEAIDQINLTVPIACTMTGTGTIHTATLNPGTYSGASGSEYENGIGKTTLTAICNDDNGFSIYAIGYTDDQQGVTTLVGANTGKRILTKVFSSGDSESNWSMKVAGVNSPSESYNPQNLSILADVDGSFESWHSIPDTQTRIAQYKANTGSSVTDTTLGVKLETTYAAFVASNQPADTYIGQVKYTMVHPYDGIEPDGPIRKEIEVLYSAGGAFFGSDASWKTNLVTYEVYCSKSTGDHLVYHSANIDKYGNKTASFTSLIDDNGYESFNEITIPGASKLKIELNYDLLFNEENPIIESEYENYHEHGDIGVLTEDGLQHYYGTGTQTIIVDNDSVIIGVMIDDMVSISQEHDYGYFATVYPLDENDEQYVFDLPCVWRKLDGEYMEPNHVYNGYTIYEKPFLGWTDDYDGLMTDPSNTFRTYSNNAESLVLRHLEEIGLPGGIEMYNIPQ